MVWFLEPEPSNIGYLDPLGKSPWCPVFLVDSRLVNLKAEVNAANVRGGSGFEDRDVLTFWLRL